MIWVDDVQKGSQVEWPLQHASALLGVHGVCACKLLLNSQGLAEEHGGAPVKIEAVLEVFLPTAMVTVRRRRKLKVDISLTPCVESACVSTD